MKAFFVKEYVKDERFKALVENVLNAKNPDDLLFYINELDFFVCENSWWQKWDEFADVVTKKNDLQKLGFETIFPVVFFLNEKKTWGGKII